MTAVFYAKVVMNFIHIFALSFNIESIHPPSQIYTLNRNGINSAIVNKILWSLHLQLSGQQQNYSKHRLWLLY